MTIRPTTPGPSSRIDRTREDVPTRTGSKPERTAGASGAPTRNDEVQISTPARLLQTHAGPESIPHGELDEGRLHGISERIARGDYDKPEVIDEVLLRIASDI